MIQEKKNRKIKRRRLKRLKKIDMAEQLKKMMSQEIEFKKL